MADHRIPLPQNFTPVQAIEPGHSRTRHVAASLANIAEIIQPGSSANYQALVSQIYEEATHEPDVPANTIGMSKEDVLAWLGSRGIACIDMSGMFTDITSLKREIQAQNLAGVVQLFIINDESKLTYGMTDIPLHNWSMQIAITPGTTSLLRVGYSDDIATADYIDSELPATVFTQPVPISFDSIEAAGLLAVIAILPAGVAAPPADFRYFAGTTGPDNTGALLPPNVWPIPEPPKATVDATAVSTVLQALRDSEDAASRARAAKIDQLIALFLPPASATASPSAPVSAADVQQSPVIAGPTAG